MMPLMIVTMLAMKGEDKAQIEARTTTLEQVAQPLFAAAQQQTPPAGDAGAQAGASAKHDDVVDAEFTEVKDDK